MKIHWGHKIAAVYIVFALGMIFFVWISLGYENELVTENYYEAEVQLSGQMIGAENLKRDSIDVSVRALNGGIAIHLKAPKGQGMPNGTVQLYKPDRAASDTTLVLSLDNKGDMFIPNPNGIGKFGIIFNFTIDGIPYYALRDIYV